MPFPVSITGTISVSKAECGLTNVDQAAIRIADMLDTALATRVSRAGSTINFTGGLFRPVFSWNILIYFYSGEIALAEDQDIIYARYFGSMVQMLVTVTLMIAAGIVVVTLQSEQRGLAERTPLLPFLFGWLWLFGANYVMAAMRFPRWLEAGLRRSALPTAAAL